MVKINDFRTFSLKRSFHAIVRIRRPLEPTTFTTHERIYVDCEFWTPKFVFCTWRDDKYCTCENLSAHNDCCKSKFSKPRWANDVDFEVWPPKFIFCTWWDDKCLWKSWRKMVKSPGLAWIQSNVSLRVASDSGWCLFCRKYFKKNCDWNFATLIRVFHLKEYQNTLKRRQKNREDWCKQPTSEK